MEKIGIAVFGAGRTGTIHATNLAHSERAEIRWIVDAIPANGRRLAGRLHMDGDKTVVKFGDHNKVLNDVSVHAVVVTVPSQFHTDIVKECLSAGKSVFCEKPLTLASQTTEECCKHAQTVNKPLMCGFNRRFDPTVQSIYNQIQNGVLGQIQSIKTCSRDPGYPPAEYLKSSGGVFIDSCCHDIDVICHIVGEFPSTVFATAHAFNVDIAEAGDYDQVMILMKFPSGVTGNIDMNRSAAYGYDQRLEVFGSKGMLQEGNTRPTASILSTSAGECLDPTIVEFCDRYKDAYRNEMDHFLDVVSGKKELIITKEQIVAVQKIAEACLTSVKTGQAVTMNY